MNSLFSVGFLLKRAFLIGAFFIFPLVSFAEVQVAFIEYHKPNGELVQLEENGRFYHIAISYQGKWLQAHPYYGVIVSSLEDLGKVGLVAEILTLKDRPVLTETDVKSFLGKQYDREFSWSDEKIYCSELVAKLLGLAPQPMNFSPDLWPVEYQKYNGLPGISPDKIYWCLHDGICS